VPLRNYSLTPWDEGRGWRHGVGHHCKVRGLFWLPLLVRSIWSAHYQERQRIQYQYEVFITTKVNGP